MKYKIMFIIVAVLSMISVIFFLAIEKEKKQYKSFSMEGYILSSENDLSTGNTIKYYFPQTSKYKSKYPDLVSFEDVSGNNVEVKNTDVIHYSDGSMEFLKKSVIMNLEDVNSKNLKYYNIFDDTVLNKTGDSYSVENAGKNLKFTDFIIRISDTKYVIVSKNLKLVTSNTQKQISGYLEMNITDGEIVTLANQEVSLKTVSSDSYILLGGHYKLNLSDNKIYYDSTEKMSLAQLVINSDDNIVIEKDEEKEETKEQQTIQNGGTNVNNGGTTTDNGNEEEKQPASLPAFFVTKMEVSTNKIDSNIKIVDNDGMLNGNLSIKILETNSGKLVYNKEENSGTYSIDIFVENLNPDTNYTLIMNSNYLKDEIMYNRDFLVKSFRTNLLGITVSKDYYTKNSLKFLLKEDSQSEIKSADAMLFDSNNKLIKKITVDQIAAKEGYEMEIVDLYPNTSYKLVVTNFLYDTVVISSGYELTIECKTLKNKPTFGELSTVIDKKNGDFTLKANNVSDIDNGIQTFKYEVYDARLISEANTQPIAVIEKSRLGTVEVPVDEKTIFRGVPYVFKLITEFYDNEKYIEYESEYSSVFKMDGVTFPSVRFEASNVTFEKIEGTIIITDEGSTISLGDSLITVIYSNSTGNSKSFTTTGNLSIPFSANNLRANESYTISLYTTVNLQDGNDPIDNCFIGSVIIRTNETQSMEAKFVSNSIDVTKAFSVNTELGATDGINNTLEATTLTGITFNLYSGKTTTGTLVKSIKKIDRDLEPYTSDLKNDYYDKSFSITPEFFGVSNSDMTEEFYTIEITGAYDYTDYKNNIPITNQTTTVKSTGFIPDLPPNINNAVEVNAIRNKDAGANYKADLNPDTIVGYKVKGAYDNSRLYAKYIKYYVYNADTGVLINPEGTVVNVDETGEINYAEFYLGYGTSYEINDTDLRRGNNYYFTYKAYLDLNSDDIAETVYPYSDSVVLKSAAVSPKKQEPIIKIYPSISTTNSLTVKYMATDVDKALIVNSFYNKIGTSDKSTTPIIIGNTVYASATLTNLSKGYLSVETSQATLKTSSNIVRKQLMYQYFDSVFVMKQLNFHAVVDVNRVIISILDYDANLSYTSRISALKVTFTSGTTSIVKDNMALDDDRVIVDLSQIKQFIGQNVTISVQAYYDTGITGYDITGSKVALQNVLKDGVGGQYFTINTSNNFRTDAIANGSIYNMTFTSPTSITFNNLASLLNKTIISTCDQSGIYFNYEYLLPKKLDVKDLLGDGTQVIQFNSIVPGISLLDVNSKLNISSTLRTAQVNLKFYGADASQLENNRFYLELYETNESGSESKYINTTYVTVSGVDNVINISNLNPKTQYYIKCFANVYNGITYVKTQLYDVNFQTNTKIYYFSTLSIVGMSNVSARYIATDYLNKNIRITYNLSQIVGFDKIVYKLYKYVRNPDGSISKVLVNAQINDDVIFNKSMTKNVPCAPGSDFTFGTNYNLVATPIAYVTIDGKQTEVELDDAINYDFYLDNLRVPFVGISAIATEDIGLEFKISISDISKIIVNGKYTIKVLDYNDNDITPATYKNVQYSITSLNNTIIVSGLERAKEYKLVVTTYIDKENNLTGIEKLDTVYTKTTLDDTGIDTGDIYTTMNASANSKVDLLFYNSYKLTYINQVRYSIYNLSGYAQDGTVAFIPTQMSSSGGTYYLFTLPDTLPSGGIYYIELQFLHDGTIIKTTSVDHNYVKS